MANITPRYIEQFKRKFSSPDELHGMEYEELPVTGNESNPTYTTNLTDEPEAAMAVPMHILVNLVDTNDTEIGEFDESKRWTFIRALEPNSGLVRHWKFPGLLTQDDAREWARHRYQIDYIEQTIEYKNQQLAEMAAEAKARKEHSAAEQE